MECQVLGTVGRGKHLVYKVRYADGTEEKLRSAQISRDILLTYFISQLREQRPIDCAMVEGNSDRDGGSSPNRNGSSAPGDNSNQDSPRGDGPAPGPSPLSGTSNSGRGPAPYRNYAYTTRLPASNTQTRSLRNSLPANGFRAPTAVYATPEFTARYGRQTARKSTASPAGPYRPSISKLSKYEKRK